MASEFSQRVRIGLIALILASFGCNATSERIAIAAMDPSGSAGPLIGFLFKPEGGGMHPAVVMLHGCGGAYARNGSLNARHQTRGELLPNSGYIALMLDSFTPRG